MLPVFLCVQNGETFHARNAVILGYYSGLGLSPILALPGDPDPV